jgi:phosphomannomutase
MLSKEKVLVLFDVDGTLTPSRELISPEVEAFLEGQLKPVVTVGLVSGSDLKKVAEQMGGSSEDLIRRFEFVFSENGLVAHKRGKFHSKESIAAHLGEENCQALINFCLKYMSELSLPAKRGTFVEFRDGLINICPVGRSCTMAQRKEFAALDATEGIRKTFREALMAQFPDMGLSFALGGAISIDVFPKGWDKRFCLRHLEGEGFEEIHFFGDRTSEGGNDFELFMDERTIGHTVTSPEDTVEQLKKTFNL